MIFTLYFYVLLQATAIFAVPINNVPELIRAIQQQRSLEADSISSAILTARAARTT
jgi:hypothetical protein